MTTIYQEVQTKIQYILTLFVLLYVGTVQAQPDKVFETIFGQDSGTVRGCFIGSAMADVEKAFAKDSLMFTETRDGWTHKSWKIDLGEKVLSSWVSVMVDSAGTVKQLGVFMELGMFQIAEALERQIVPWFSSKYRGHYELDGEHHWPLPLTMMRYADDRIYLSGAHQHTKGLLELRAGIQFIRVKSED